MRGSREYDVELDYAAGQVARARRYVRQGMPALAEDATNRAIDALARVHTALARPAVWDAETIVRQEG